MSRVGNPDYAVDTDRGTSSLASKQAETTETADAEERNETRDGARDLDRMVQATPGLNQIQKDRERLTPRAGSGQVAHPRMERQMAELGETRGPLSDRQKKARSRARRQVQQEMPGTQLAAQHALVSRPDVWREVNDQLSEHVGDVQALDEHDQEQVRRVDRSIRAYEDANERGHVVYANVTMPHFINSSNLHGFVRNNFEPGDRVSFDRFTYATHQLHEIAAGSEHLSGSRMATFEIQTSRGMYLGQSDKKDNTSHLLPRSMDFEVVGAGTTTYRDRAGVERDRVVIQLRDVTPTS